MVATWTLWCSWVRRRWPPPPCSTAWSPEARRLELGRWIQTQNPYLEYVVKNRQSAQRMASNIELELKRWFQAPTSDFSLPLTAFSCLLSLNTWKFIILGAPGFKTWARNRQVRTWFLVRSPSICSSLTTSTFLQKDLIWFYPGFGILHFPVRCSCFNYHNSVLPSSSTSPTIFSLSTRNQPISF